MADPNVKFFFLVGGYDYEGGGSENGIAFSNMCTGRVKEIIDILNKTLGAKDALLTEDTTLRFVRFSVETGKVQVINREFSLKVGVKKAVTGENDWKGLDTIGTGDKLDPNTFVSKGPFRAINRATDYNGWNFQQGPATSDVISIVDIYRSVRAAPEGSILELSIFSHAWVQGPILVNSSDRTHDSVLRDPDDKDGRAALDFNISMGEVRDDTISSISRIFLFGSRFDPKGVLRAWGCDFDIENIVIQQTIQQIKKLGDKDDTVLTFQFEKSADHDWTLRYRVADPESLFLPDVAQLVVSRSFLEVKAFLRRRLGQSYTFLFVNSTPAIALGALPGTSGDDEKHGYKLMQICAISDHPKTKKQENSVECPVGYAPHFKFYSKYIGINVGDRNYAVFDHATVLKLGEDIAFDDLGGL